MEKIAQTILNLPGYKYTECERHDLGYLISVSAKGRGSCIHCHSKRLQIKATTVREIRHENIANRKITLKLNARKFYCSSCKRYFWERFPGIKTYQRSTEPFRKQVAAAAFRGVTKKDIAHDYAIGEATSYRYFLEELRLQSQEILSYECPRILGIDEHHFTRKHGYVTTLCDLENHRIFDLVLGRSERALEGYFLRLKNRHRVRVVVMDLAECYRSIIRKYFPQAKIVTDRFHVIRLVNQHFLKLWQQIDPEGRRNRGLLNLMRQHYFRMSSDSKAKLQRYLKAHPELESIYWFKQDLCKLLNQKGCNQYQCKRLIPVFLSYIRQMKQSLFESMDTLANTLDSWQEEVVRMWRFTRSNGITEGFHTKMKMLIRRAYGFRNFTNYRMWVKILCR
jgi:transposase